MDLHGWAEPGTVITANGESVPVADDGLFVAQPPVSPEGAIVIEARRTNGQKRLVRQFREVVKSRDLAISP